MQKVKLHNMTSAILSQNNNVVTVRMSTKRWNRLLKLEESYKIARSIHRGMKQIADAPKMSTTEAIDLLRSL